MELKDFDYALPTGLVARYPLDERDASRLLSLYRSSGALVHGVFNELPVLLRRGDLLVLNDTKVFPARLRGLKATGGKVELLLVERLYGAEGGGREPGGGAGDLGGGVVPGIGVERGGMALWRCLARPAKGLGEGREVFFEAGISAVVRSVEGGGFIICEFKGLTEEALYEAGLVPIPPYMGREPEEVDRERYQTVFAANIGAVAAPTAGLHFTRSMLNSLKGLGVEIEYVTLHTGPATFLPVREDDIERIRLGGESYSISPTVFDAVMKAKKEGRRVIAVGTTTVRALESSVIGGLEKPILDGKTSLFIRPGFEFKMIDGLITNFHLPCSTLLMLTAAFAGYKRVMGAYKEAVKEGYRFYSYGDVMFIS